MQELPELIVGAIRAALERVDRSPGPNDLERRTAEVRDAVPPSTASPSTSCSERLGRPTGSATSVAPTPTSGRSGSCGVRSCRPAADLQPLGGSSIRPILSRRSYAELRSLVESRDGPSGDELAERARYRLEARYADAPPFLGGEPGDPLPAEWLPPAAARLERAIGAVVQAIFTAPQPRTEERMVRGLGVSRGVYEGTARVIRGTEEFGRIEQGDVLVTNSTTTAFNIVLPLLGAIVTDRGGLLSHAAIVAREYGFPAVVGCTDATSVLPDGARVHRRRDRGEAEVVA